MQHELQLGVCGGSVCQLNLLQQEKTQRSPCARESRTETRSQCFSRLKIVATKTYRTSGAVNMVCFKARLKGALLKGFHTIIPCVPSSRYLFEVISRIPEFRASGSRPFGKNLLPDSLRVPARIAIRVWCKRIETQQSHLMKVLVYEWRNSKKDAIVYYV